MVKILAPGKFPLIPECLTGSLGVEDCTQEHTGEHLFISGKEKGGCGSMDGWGNSPPAAQALTARAQNQVGSHCGEKIAGYKGRSLVRETCKVQAEPTG